LGISGCDCYGPFPSIKEVVKYAYQLELLPTMDIYLVFYVLLLELVLNDPLPGQVTPAPEPIIIEGGQEYKVEEVRQSSTFRCQLQYLIKW
jgi:hypothetical protein